MPIPSGRVFIIAEAGANHNGNFGLARRLVAMAAGAGADAVKFQTFKANECAGSFAQKADYQKRNTKKHESQLAMLKSLELPFPRFKDLQNLARKLKIEFLSTPDGLESLNFLVKLSVPFLKIGSSEITNLHFLKTIGSTGIPLILSTGMATLGEVETALDAIFSAGNADVTLMHCTTDYPAPAEDANLFAMKTMAAAFQLPVGLSDHTIGNEAAIAAVALGAKAIEKHITLDKNLPGPDQAASMSPDEFYGFVQAIRKTEQLLGNGIKRPSKREVVTMQVVRRSIVAAHHLCKGRVLEESDLAFKRPGTGLSPSLAPTVSGRRILRPFEKGEPLNWVDLSGKVFP